MFSILEQVLLSLVERVKVIELNKEYENNISGTRKRLCFFVTNKSFHTEVEDCAGGKQSKERITLALTASMMGEKLKPLVIGKAQKPRCFAFNLCSIFKQIKR